MKSIKFILLLSLSIIIYSSCSEGINDPVAGSRDYTWKVDTLNPKQCSLTLNGIWAYSTEDVWAIGFGPSADNTIWHYDGVSWKLFQQSNIIPQSIWGFANDDIWIANSYDNIWHYDGTKWYIAQKIQLAGYNRVTFNSIFGKNPNDIYAVGFADKFSDNSFVAVVAHYDGKVWSVLNIPQIHETFLAIGYSSGSDAYYINAIVLENNLWIQKVYYLKNNELKEIYNTDSTIGFGRIHGDVYINTNKKIYKPAGDKIELWKDLSGTNFKSSPVGRTEKDFISPSYDGIGHYNGTDYKTIYKTELKLTEPVMIGNDIFQLAEDSKTGLSLVIHGKLVN